MAKSQQYDGIIFAPMILCVNTESAHGLVFMQITIWSESDREPFNRQQEIKFNESDKGTSRIFHWGSNIQTYNSATFAKNQNIMAEKFVSC